MSRYVRPVPVSSALVLTRLIVGLGAFALLVLAGYVIYQYLSKDDGPKKQNTSVKKPIPEDNDKTYKLPKPPDDNDKDYTRPKEKLRPPSDPEVGDWAEYRTLTNGVVKATDKVTIVAREGSNYRVRVELVLDGKPRPAVELLQPVDKPLREKELPTVGTRNKTTTSLLGQGTGIVNLSGRATPCQIYHFRETSPATLDGKGELRSEAYYWFCSEVPFGGFVREQRNTLIFNGKPTITGAKELVRYSRGGKTVEVEPPKIEIPPPPPRMGVLDRTKWVHDKGTFEMVRPGEWEEAAPNGLRYRFKERARNQQVVELEDASRMAHVRLYADRCEVGFGPVVEYRYYYKGKWEK